MKTKESSLSQLEMGQLELQVEGLLRTATDLRYENQLLKKKLRHSLQETEQLRSRLDKAVLRIKQFISHIKDLS